MAGGSNSAFRHLFDHYRLRLHSFVLQFTHSSSDAEEIVQETFLKLWEARDRLESVLHPRNYIYTIARNLTHNYLLKAARSDQYLRTLYANMQEGDTSIESVLDAKESQALIQGALSQLSSQKQEIFRLSRQEGLSHEEIAQKLQLSKSRVKNIIVEVLKYIKTYLDRHSTTLGLIFYFSCHQLLG